MEQLLCPNCTGAFDLQNDLIKGFLRCSYCLTTVEYSNDEVLYRKLSNWLEYREHQFVVALIDFIYLSTNKEELIYLIDKLNADKDFGHILRYDNLGSSTHQGKCRDMVTYCQRRGALENLFGALLVFRPKVREIVV